ncbi:MAG: c-type cytochrome domain-containing protein [Pirellulaceae bacterium]
MQNTNRLFLTLLAVAMGTSPAAIRCVAQEVAEEAEKKITFDEHIKPIFREHCTTCHSESDKESDLALDTYAGAMAGGSSGAVIKENNASGSRLFALIAHTERPFMPPDEDPIAKEKIELVKTWIEQGMPENSGSKIKRSHAAAAAMLGGASLGKPEGPPPMPEKLLLQPVIETARSAAISAMAASPWAPLVAIGGQEQVALYHTESGELLGVIPFPEGEPQSLTFTRDGKQLLIGGGRHSHSGCAVLVDIASGERLSKVGDELDIVLAADISPDKSRIAIAGPQKIVRVFDTVSAEQVLEMKKHTDWIFCLRYSPDGVLLASGDRSNAIVVWEADTGRLYADLVGHKDQVRSLDFRADSNVLASASLDGTIKLWDMFENKEIKAWAAHGGGVNAVMFAHNGMLASAGRDARVKTWNANGELQKEFTGLSESALEVALTGDGSYVAGGDWNGHAQMWKAEDPNQVKMIAANPPSIEHRLESAGAALAAINAQFEAAKQSSTAASTAASEAQAAATTAAQAAAALAQKVTETTAQEATLTQQVATNDAQITELEAQLAALKDTRNQTATQLATVKATLAETTQQSTSAAQAAEAAQAKHSELAAAAAAAAQKQQELAAQVAAAQAEADKAAAAKAALDARAAELDKLTQDTAAAAKALVDQFTVAKTEQQAQQASLDKLSVEMNAVKEQMAVLQKRLEEASAAQAAAQTQMQAAAGKTEALKSQLDQAEQAALSAKDQLELFQKSYQQPN